jgi:hypothetical protein
MKWRKKVNEESRIALVKEIETKKGNQSNNENTKPLQLFRPDYINQNGPQEIKMFLDRKGPKLVHVGDKITLFDNEKSGQMSPKPYLMVQEPLIVRGKGGNDYWDNEKDHAEIGKIQRPGTQYSANIEVTKKMGRIQFNQ